MDETDVVPGYDENASAPRGLRICTAASHDDQPPELWDGRRLSGAVNLLYPTPWEDLVMQARTSTWTGTPDALDAWVEHVRTNVKPMIAALPGNAGALFLIDRAAGRALTLTIWSTDESARSSDATADASRARTQAATGVELLERGSYEVVDGDLA